LPFPPISKQQGQFPPIVYQQGQFKPISKQRSRAKRKLHVLNMRTNTTIKCFTIQAGRIRLRLVAGSKVMIGEEITLGFMLAEHEFYID
jgi:hypothetical protein